MLLLVVVDTLLLVTVMFVAAEELVGNSVVYIWRLQSLCKGVMIHSYGEWQVLFAPIPSSSVRG